MKILKLLLCISFVAVQASHSGPEARMATPTASVGVLDSVLRGNVKSRQSRCVRCYEDRYYGAGGDRYGSGSYASRGAEDPRSSWYYSYDRYDDRSSSSSSRDRDYDRYYGRDDRYAPRTYDRYEGRGYDDYYRRGSSYDRGSGYAYGGYAGYDNRDRYYTDRYDGNRDRYYDRSRSGYGSYDKYDPYDRYYSRYDFRNYRPWDETYRGQSGFDNSGRGYYFAGDDDRSTHPFYDRERAQTSSYSSSASSSSSGSPCGHLVANCPYGDRGTKISSSAIGSDGYRGGGGYTSVMGGDHPMKPLGQGGWTYLGDQDKQSKGGSSGGGGSSGSGSSSSSNGGVGGGASAGSAAAAGGVGGRDRDRERDQQSSPYGGRPRPLGGSYLFDRDSNAVSDSASADPNPNGVGNPGDDGVGHKMLPAAAAQTAPAPHTADPAKDQDKDRQ